MEWKFNLPTQSTNLIPFLFAESQQNKVDKPLETFCKSNIVDDNDDNFINTIVDDVIKKPKKAPRVSIYGDKNVLF